LNKSFLLIILFFLVITLQVFASGKKDADDRKTHNDDWVLCITNFDLSSLPPEKTNIAEVILKELVTRMNAINYRTRISHEYAYYEEYAWSRDRAAAARALSAKLDERSQLLFRGEPEWRYRQNLRRIDSDIERLRANLEEAENNVPLIHREPEFKLHSRNLDYFFPPAPKEGTEFKFAGDQRADAFLTGSISDFHGRYFLAIKLYTVYTRAFVWEDSVIFSHNDYNNALEEISRRLLIFLSGNVPAVVAVKAEPEEALVLINRSFAGRGETAMIEYPPGRIIVTASAAEHESLTFETEVAQGESLNISIRLNPIEYGEMEIKGNLEGHVYYGALYAGESPLTLRLPSNKMEYIEMIYPGLETEERNEARPQNVMNSAAVFQTPQAPGFSQSVSLSLTVPIRSNRVKNERSAYYWAWGTQWITGIAAWIAYYTYTGSNNTIRINEQNSGDRFILDNINLYYLSAGTLIAFGAASVYGIYRMIRYIYYSGRDAAVIIKPGTIK